MKDREHGAGRREGSVGDLVRETADGLGRLVSQHLKLAQIELTANLRVMMSRAAVVAVCAVLIIVGYTLTMTGIALIVGGNRASGIPLVGIGAVHMVGAGVGMLVVLARRRRIRIMKTTATVLGESASALIAPRAAARVHIGASQTPSASPVIAVSLPADRQSAHAR